MLYDDRPKVSPGVKFKDAELIGVPTIVVVGKGLADGTIEVKDRASGEREDVPADHVVDHLVGLVRPDARPGTARDPRLRFPQPADERNHRWSCARSTCPAVASTSASPARPTAGRSCSCTASSSTTRSGPTCPSGWASRASAPSPRPGRSARTPRAMKPDADLSPRGVAHLVLSFLRMLDLTDVTLVGSDTGGAICQFLLDEDASRIGRLVLTNCDAFDTFPPFPFDLLFRLGRHPVAARRVLQPMRLAAAAQQPARLRLARAPQAHGRREPALGDAVPHRCGGTPRRHRVRCGPGAPTTWPTSRPGCRPSTARCCCAGRRRTGSSRSTWRTGSPTTFPDARLVEFPDALTFVSLDQPAPARRGDRTASPAVA